MSSSISPLIPLPSSSSLALTPLPFTIDLSCPIALPSKPVAIATWPFNDAGPSSSSLESPASFVKRRYLETVYLSDNLSPISHLVQDIRRLTPTQTTDHSLLHEVLEPLLLTLSQIEARHRRTLLPVFSSLISTSATSSSEVQVALIEETLTSSGLDANEQQVLKVALELRSGSRAMSDGGVMQAKRLSEEHEKRETLIQVALLFLYIAHAPPPAAPKKRKREHRRRNSASALPVTADPAASLELLMDRLSVWSAVAELGIGIDETIIDLKGKGKENGVQLILRNFWEDVIISFFLIQQPDLSESFHLKVFGSPIPPQILPPPPTTKKPRKPKLTRARPSTDALTQPDFPLVPVLRVPSEAGSRASPPPERRRERERSLSRTTSISRQRSESQQFEYRRSRSASVDPPMSQDGLNIVQPKKGLVRNASSKDMFKGRQVGLMRRTASVVVKKSKADGQSQTGLGRNESFGKIGLLGRKTSDPIRRRDSAESSSQSQSYVRSQSHSQTQTQRSASQGTLIFATPSKPRLANSIFGPRLNGWIAPTPIQEEPSSNERERPNYITETPVAHGRIAPFPGSGGMVAETPIGQGGGSRLSVESGRFSDMRIRALSDAVLEEKDEEEEDHLGDLMVMTDDEGDDGDEDDGGEGDQGTTGQRLVPETPAR